MKIERKIMKKVVLKRILRIYANLERITLHQKKQYSVQKQNLYF